MDHEYISEKGEVVKVSSGISGGKYWMTCAVKESGSLRRVKSKFLPEREARSEAQRDLDNYAQEKSWAKVL